MKQIKLLLILWAMFVGSSAIAQSVAVSINNGVAGGVTPICATANSFAFDWTPTGYGTAAFTNVEARLHLNTPSGLVVASSTTGAAAVTTAAVGQTALAFTYPALTAGSVYYLVVEVTKSGITTSSSVPLVATAVTTPFFTVNPGLNCLNNSALAAVTTPIPGATYTWAVTAGTGTFSPLTSGVATGTTTTVTPTATGTFVISCTISLPANTTSCTAVSFVGAGAAGVVNVATTTPTLASSAGTGAICSGGAVTLSTVTGSGCPAGSIVKWYVGTTIVGSGTPFVTTVTNSTTYRANCEANGCQGPFATIGVTTMMPGPAPAYTAALAATPTVLLALPVTLCIATGTQNVTLTVACPATATAVSWNGGAAVALPAGAANTVAQSTAVAGTTNYTVQCVTGACASAVTTIPVTVQDPTAPNVIPTPLSLCPGAPFTLNASPTTSCAAINWYEAAAPAVLVATGGSVVLPAPTTAGNYTYQAKCTTAAGCVSPLSSGAFNVTVNVAPGAPTGIVSYAGCVGASVAIPAPAATCATGTLTWSPSTPVAYSAAQAAAFTATVVTYTARCVDATTACPSAAVTYTLTLQGAPAASTVMPASGDLCIDLAAPQTLRKLTANCPVGLTTMWEAQADGATWVALAGSGVNTATTSFNSIDATTAVLLPGGTLTFTNQLVNAYKVRVTCMNAALPAACQASAATVNTYQLRNPEPAPTIALYDNTANAVAGTMLCGVKGLKLAATTVCSGGVIDWYRATSADAGATWSTPVGVGTGTPFVIAMPPAGLQRYSATCSNNCASAYSATTSITINYTTAPLASAAVSAVNGVATTSASCVVMGDNVTVTLTGSGCTPNTGVFGVTAKLNGTTFSAANYTASATGTFTASGGAFAPAAGVTDSYTYDVTCTDPTTGCASSVVTTTATITTKPAAPTALMVSNPIICTGGSSMLSATCATGTTVMWYTSAGVAVGSGSPTVMPTTTTAYYATCSVGSCASLLSATQATVQVVNASALGLAITGATMACPANALGNKTIMLTLTGCTGAGAMIQWSEAGTAITAVNGGNMATISVTPSALAAAANGGTVTYSASCSLTGGCAQTISQVVTVNAAVNIAIATLQTVPACVGGQLDIYANPANMNAYSWCGPGIVTGTCTGGGSGSGVVPGAITSGNATSRGFTIAATTTGNSGVYTVTGELNGCYYSTSRNIVLNYKPATPTIAGVTGKQCIGSPITLSSSCLPTETAHWQVGSTAPTSSATALSTANIWNFTAPAPTATSTSVTYRLFCRSVDGCYSSVNGTSAQGLVDVKLFDFLLLNVGQSQSKTIPSTTTIPTPATPSTVWPAIVPDNNATIPFDASTASAPSLIFNDGINGAMAAAPRFWTSEIKACPNAPAFESVYFLFYRYDEINGQFIQSYNAIENAAPWFMFGNVSYTKLYTINDPQWGGGSQFDTGFPRGRYSIGVELWTKDGINQNPLIPSNIARTIDPTATKIVKQEYFFNITNSGGVFTGPARIGSAGDSEVETELAAAYPNPAKSKLNVIINNAKGQDVQLNLVDVMGRSILKKNVTPASDIHTEEVDVTSANTGIYFMKVQTPSKSQTLKVTKQ